MGEGYERWGRWLGGLQNKPSQPRVRHALLNAEPSWQYWQ